ncbi:MAG: hypothetical protein J5616_06745 [Bacteroidaceae bacterium]|nr:hypothetical protein [Bacteroidaceae bacterium]
MKKTNEFIQRLTSVVFVLALLTTSVSLTSCDELIKTLEQLDEQDKQDNSERQSKSDLPPIGSVIVKNVMQEDEEEVEAAEDILPQFNQSYVNEDGGAWVFSPSDEEGVLDATYADPTKKRPSHCYLQKRANSAYDIYPKNGDIPVSIGVIRIKENGKAIEEARGSKKSIFVISE